MYATLIAACDFNKVIGNGLEIPWKIREDLKQFKQKTFHNNIIMGRKTYDSLGNKALPSRTNIVLTTKAIKYRNEKLQGKHEGVIFEDTAEAALSSCIPDREIFIIGGSEIYKLFLEKDYIQKAYISLVKRTFYGDCYLPNLGSDWVIDKTLDYEDFTLLEMRRII